MSERLRSILPITFFENRRTTKERQALAGSFLGALGLAYVVEGGQSRLRTRRVAILMIVGAAAGYIAGPLTPTPRDISK